MPTVNTLTVATFNIDSRSHGGKAKEQLRLLQRGDPADLIALQEVTRAALPTYRRELRDLGFAEENIVDTFYRRVGGRAEELPSPGVLGQVVASRWPVRRLAPMAEPDLPYWPSELRELFEGKLWAERLLSVEVNTGRWGKIELHSAHVPPATGRLPRGRTPTPEEEKQAWFKVFTAEAMHYHLARPSRKTRILCGDFNMPIAEIDENRIAAGCQEVVETYVGGALEKGVRYVSRVRSKGHQRGFSPELWVECELRLLTGLGRFGMVDTFRYLYGYGDTAAPSYSYYTSKRFRTPKNRRRYDHILASVSLNPVRGEYMVDIVEDKWSDHAPYKVAFRPQGDSGKIGRDAVRRRKRN